jgi:hypothetical protein
MIDPDTAPEVRPTTFRHHVPKTVAPQGRQITDAAASEGVIDPVTGQERELPKGSCVIVHRGHETVMENAPGRRIVSVKIDVWRSDEDPITKAYDKLMVELDRNGAPAAHEVSLLAKWYDPSDSTVKFRLRIPHARYASWRENTFVSVSPTRALQKIDDRVDILFDGSLPTTKARTRQGRAAVTSDAPAAPAPVSDDWNTGWDIDRVRRNGPPSGVRQTIASSACLAVLAVLFMMGGNWLIAMAPVLAFLMVDGAFFAQARNRWKAVRAIDLANENQRQNAVRTLTPPPSDEWDVVRGAVTEHAPDRVDEVARAEMRIRSLLETPVASVNPIVTEATGRIGNSLRTLVAAHRAPASMATEQEAALLASRLADSICALGAEAEDARLVAFRDAVFDFNATARYIEARNDASLRLSDDTTNP